MSKKYLIDGVWTDTLPKQPTLEEVTVKKETTKKKATKKKPVVVEEEVTKE